MQDAAQKDRYLGDDVINKSNNSAIGDLSVSAFFLLWAAAGWTSIYFKDGLFSDPAAGLDPGPGLLPVIVLSILTIGGLALAVGGLRKWRTLVWPTFNFRNLPIEQATTLAFYLSVVAFPLAMMAIGYRMATFLFVLAWTVGLAPNPTRSSLRGAVVAVAAASTTTLLVYCGFELVIGVRLP